MTRTCLIFIGDPHFGRAGNRNADRYRALDQIIDYGFGLDNLGAWCFAGDLFDTKSVIEDRNAIAARLQRMASVAPVCLPYGNHDLPGDLDVFARLAASHPIAVVDAPQVLHWRLATGVAAAIFVAPYKHRASTILAGAVPSLVPEAAEGEMAPVFTAAAAEMDSAAVDGALTCVLAHQNIRGALSSVGQPQIGADIEFTPSLLERLGDRLKVFGHIHLPQEIHGAHFVGSLIRQDYGEREEKRFLVAQFERAGDCWVYELRSVPIDIPRMHNVEGRLSPQAFDILSVDGGTDKPATWDGSDVKCKYSYRKDEIGALDVAKIHAEFAGCRSLKLDAVPVIERDVRAPEVAAAVTVDEKAQAYCALNRQSWTPGLREKLAALQTREGAAVLADVAQLVAAAGTQPGDVDDARRAVA